jgi:hypothetical protein
VLDIERPAKFAKPIGKDSAMFSLKSLLFMVTLAALGAAGLVYRNDLWASAIVAITLGLLLFAGSYAWFGPKARTFWGPFALTGTAYLAIVSLQPLQELHYNLPTTQLVTYALQKLQTPTPVSSAGYYMSSGVTYYATPSSGYAPVPSEAPTWVSQTPSEPPMPVETASFESPADPGPRAGPTTTVDWLQNTNMATASLHRPEHSFGFPNVCGACSWPSPRG